MNSWTSTSALCSVPSSYLVEGYLEMAHLRQNLRGVPGPGRVSTRPDTGTRGITGFPDRASSVGEPRLPGAGTCVPGLRGFFPVSSPGGSAAALSCGAARSAGPRAPGRLQPPPRISDLKVARALKSRIHTEKGVSAINISALFRGNFPNYRAGRRGQPD